MNVGETYLSKFVKSRCETRTKNNVFEYCALNLWLYYHPNQNKKRRLNQMVRGYLGSYKQCPRCNYHFWTRNEFFKHNKLCTTETKFYTTREKYKFAAIERTKGRDLFDCFFCSNETTFKTEKGFALHCYEQHKKLLKYIGLNEWECYRVAYDDVPQYCKPRTYTKRNEKAVSKELMEGIIPGNDADNQENDAVIND